MSSEYGDIIELSFVRVMENVLKQISLCNQNPTNELYKHLHKSRRMPIYISKICHSWKSQNSKNTYT